MVDDWLMNLCVDTNDVNNFWYRFYDFSLICSEQSCSVLFLCTFALIQVICSRWAFVIVGYGSRFAIAQRTSKLLARFLPNLAGINCTWLCFENCSYSSSLLQIVPVCCINTHKGWYIIKQQQANCCITRLNEPYKDSLNENLKKSSLMNTHTTWHRALIIGM